MTMPQRGHSAAVGVQGKAALRAVHVPGYRSGDASNTADTKAISKTTSRGERER